MTEETPSLFDESPMEPIGADQTSGPLGPLVRVRMIVAYDGTDFRGLAPNPGVRTVVGELVKVLTAYLHHSPDIVMSGRTDAGVHATGQVLSFDAPLAWFGSDEDGAARLQKMINSRLAPEIVASEVAVVAPDFNARFDALGRRYRYRILNRAFPDPLLARSVWHIASPLDLSVMRLACDPILGEHDFSSFCRRPKRKRGLEESGAEGSASASSSVSLVRRVDRARWHDAGDGLLEFHIEGSAFCHQMVRSIVGFHVAVGRGKRSAGELRSVLGARNRDAAEQPAPPHGLNLLGVMYRD